MPLNLNIYKGMIIFFLIQDFTNNEKCDKMMMPNKNE